MSENGGTHLFLFNLARQRIAKNQPEVAELVSEDGDITLNKELFDSKSPLDRSLSTYLKFLYVEYP